MFQAFHKAAKRNNVQAYYERDKKQRIRLPQYNESYVKNAKKQRFQKTCDHAGLGCVWIADSCPDEFVHGDGVHAGALTQASKWIPRKGGESNLKVDDHFDSWARATDSKLQQFAPQPTRNVYDAPKGTDPFAHFRNPEVKRGPTLTRYI